MPTYENVCTKCSYEDTYVQTMTNCLLTPPCSKCGSETKKEYRSVPMAIVQNPAAGGGLHFVSPASGKLITSQRAYKEDMARTNCREYEGFEQECKEAKRRVAYQDEKIDKQIDEAVEVAAAQVLSTTDI